MKAARIAALLAIAVVCGSYAVDLPLWGAALLVAAIVTPIALMAAYDHLWGVHAETRRLLAEGHRLAQEVAALPERY
jgi:hypothetical protein